jgi:predicted nucleic acid-binding protein
MFDRTVVNAGPLVALALLDLLDLLPALFPECWVPKAVFNEVAVAGMSLQLGGHEPKPTIHHPASNACSPPCQTTWQTGRTGPTR